MVNTAFHDKALNTKKPKRRFILFGKLICPICGNLLKKEIISDPFAIYYQKLKSTIKFEAKLFTCCGCDYIHEEFKPLPSWDERNAKRVN